VRASDDAVHSWAFKSVERTNPRQNARATRLIIYAAAVLALALLPLLVPLLGVELAGVLAAAIVLGGATLSALRVGADDLRGKGLVRSTQGILEIVEADGVTLHRVPLINVTRAYAGSSSDAVVIECADGTRLSVRCEDRASFLSVLDARPQRKVTTVALRSVPSSSFVAFLASCVSFLAAIVAILALRPLFMPMPRGRPEK
jgi:hypothetical protein